MSTNKHTEIAFGAARSAAVINAPLGQLDAAIVLVETALAGSAHASAVLTGTAASGQKVLPYTGAPGAFIVGQSIWIGDIAGLFEVGVIASIQAGVSLTVVTNLTNTYAAGKIIAASPAELVQARGGYGSLDLRLAATSAIPATVFPGSPAVNQLSRRTDRGGALYMWDGTAWRQLDIPAVAAFWATPSTNDRCFRTDIKLAFRYDGANWVTQWSGAKAYRTSTLAVGAGATVAVLMGNEEFDTDAYHDSGGGASSGRLTVPANMGGLYRLSYHLHTPIDTTAGPQIIAWLRANGVTPLRGSATGLSDALKIPAAEFVHSGEYVLAAADYVELVVYSVNAVTVGHANVDLDTTFSILRVGG